jgi:hypothetical protein
MGQLHNEELHISFHSPNIEVSTSVRVIWAGHVACMREMRNPFKVYSVQN